MGDTGEKTDDETEAVKQRRRTAEHVVFCEGESVADEPAVVDQTAWVK